MSNVRMIRPYAHIQGVETGVVGDVVIDIDGDEWEILVNKSIIKVNSQRTYMSEAELESKLSKVISFARCSYTFAFEAPTRWGFSSNILEDVDGFFPSRHDLNTLAYLHTDTFNDTAVIVFDDVCSLYDKDTHRLMEYWRRGFELHELSYNVESFLNYAKIMEYLTDDKQLKNDKYREFKKMAIDVGASDPVAHRTANLMVKFGFKRVGKSMVEQVARLFYARNDLNIAHDKIALESTKFSAQGEYSDDFDYLVELEEIKEITRLLILHNLGFDKYWLLDNGGLLDLKKA